MRSLKPEVFWTKFNEATNTSESEFRETLREWISEFANPLALEKIDDDCFSFRFKRGLSVVITDITDSSEEINNVDFAALLCTPDDIVVDYIKDTNLHAFYSRCIDVHDLMKEKTAYCIDHTVDNDLIVPLTSDGRKVMAFLHVSDTHCVGIYKRSK